MRHPGNSSVLQPAVCGQTSPESNGSSFIRMRLLQLLKTENLIEIWSKLNEGLQIILMDGCIMIYPLFLDKE